MSLAVSYNKYEMFSDEEQLIYEDDDDYEGWEDNNQAITDRTNIPSPTGSQRFDNVSIGDALDNEYFQDRTLSSISTPANRIWNLATKSGYVKIVCYECQTFLFAITPYFSIFYNNTYNGTSNKKGFFGLFCYWFHYMYLTLKCKMLTLSLKQIRVLHNA